jgi:hypothetical protein
MFEATQNWDSANKLRLWTSATSRRRSRQDDSSNRTSLARFSKSWSFQVHKDESVIHNSNNIQWCKNVNESMWGSEIDFEYKSLQRVAATYKDTACIDTKTPKMCLHLFWKTAGPMTSVSISTIRDLSIVSCHCTFLLRKNHRRAPCCTSGLCPSCHRKYQKYDI